MTIIDAAQYSVIETLKNGTVVRIRSIRTDDKNRLAEAFRNLKGESIYPRFFCHKNALSDDKHRTAAEVDFENTVALVVLIGEDDAETIIGSGRYSVINHVDLQRSAEVSFTVKENYHGQRALPAVWCGISR